jgi:uncharacterized membrane protein (Fun14 family)
MDIIKKNRLDLAYQRQLCFLNFILTIGIGSIISVLLGITLNPKEWFIYSIIGITISALAYIGYSQIDDNLKKISQEIKNIY